MFLKLSVVLRRLTTVVAGYQVILDKRPWTSAYPKYSTPPPVENRVKQDDGPFRYISFFVGSTEQYCVAN